MSMFHPHTDTKRFHQAVERCLNFLTPIEKKFDVIVTRGVSGTAVGAVVAYIMKKQLCVIRKPGEQAHVGAIQSGEVSNVNKAVWLDDFIESGATQKAVTRALKAQPKYTVLYGNWAFQLSSDMESTNLVPVGVYPVGVYIDGQGGLFQRREEKA